MSERSIQIWFQNRRAKVKHMQKKAQMQIQQAAICAQLYHYQMSSLMQSPTLFNPYIQRIPRAQSVDVLPYNPLSLIEPLIPPNSFHDSNWNDIKLSRQSMPPVPQTEHTKFLEEFPETNHISSSPSTFCDNTSNYFSVSPVNEPLLDNKMFYISNTEAEAWYCNNSPTTVSTSLINPESLHFSFLDKDDSVDPFTVDSKDGDFIKATTLMIGAWHRVKLNADDLICKFSQNQRAFIWYIEENLSQFKIIIPLSLITQIENLSVPATTEEESSIQFYLNHPPLFYMRSDDNKWVQCCDFTENQQGSMCLQHSLKGPTGQLKQELNNLADKLEEIKILVQFDKPLLSSQG
ncbi:hypothetical protein K501DRAFT_247805 [Backusella circina FSU 941]|nr:hypothetical protein K501DRAFT_247805 [Backusella circina FSU 941]